MPLRGGLAEPLDRLRSVLLQAESAFRKRRAQIVLRAGIAGLGALQESLIRGALVVPPDIVRAGCADSVPLYGFHGFLKPLIGRLEEPVGRLVRVRGHCGTFLIQEPQMVLGFGVALFRGPAEPLQGLHPVLLQAVAFKIHEAQIVAGAEDADGDLAAVGDKNFSKLAFYH